MYVILQVNGTAANKTKTTVLNFEHCLIVVNVLSVCYCCCCWFESGGFVVQFLFPGEYYIVCRVSHGGTIDEETQLTVMYKNDTCITI